MEEEENYERIISKVKEAVNSPEFSDILIRSKNKTFHCHKIILSSREGGWGIEQSLASTNILHWPDIKDNIALWKGFCTRFILEKDWLPNWTLVNSYKILWERL